MLRSRTLTAAVLLPSAIALGACGDGGGVSKDDYAQELDEVCTGIEAQTESIGQVRPGNSQELTEQLGKIRTAISDGIQRLRDIERPDGADGEQAQEYIDKVESDFQGQLVPALDDLQEAVRARDEVKVRAAAARLQSIDDGNTDELARDLGADKCAEG